MGGAVFGINVREIDVLVLGTNFDSIEYALKIANMVQVGKLFDTLSMNDFTADEIEKIIYKIHCESYKIVY
ncbi:MAG: hypothetical protein H6Q68_1436 [Firmicutes bacterium]|nr:hypothetical protein [Bacillota bacterium]